MTLRARIIDTWTALTYKKRWTDWQAPHWTGQENFRRLQAYTLLQSYRDNVASEYLDTEDEDKRENRREYGDVETIIETIVDALLGEDVTIAVWGAGFDGDLADPQADALQEWFDEWDDKERPILTIIEGEGDCVGLGDTCYVVGYDSTKGRPTITVYDPGHYFPVLDQSDPREYPSRVHIAWQYDLITPDGTETFIRRITWQLVTVDAVRSYPWNAEGSSITCLMTDATWNLKELDRRSVDDFNPSAAVYATNADGNEVRDLDLNCDFIPVVHVPNTTSRKEHFGRAVVTKVLQLLDELQAADTDLALTARTTGFPPIGVTGYLETTEDGRTVTTYGPGTVLQGKVEVVDTSSSLDALLKYIDHLLKRLSTNIRLPESALGRVDFSSNIAGITVSLTFGPLVAMIRRMRLAREEKYPILFKFVARFAMQAGLIDKNTDLPKVSIHFGTFLPADRQGRIAEVRDLFKEGLVSRLTAIKMLVEDAGMEIDDAEAEVLAIEHDDFTGAKILADALESPEPAAEYLGRKLPAAPVQPPAPPPPPPVVTVPVPPVPVNGR